MEERRAQRNPDNRLPALIEQSKKPKEGRNGSFWVRATPDGHRSGSDSDPKTEKVGVGRVPSVAKYSEEFRPASECGHFEATSNSSASSSP